LARLSCDSAINPVVLLCNYYVGETLRKDKAEEERRHREEEAARVRGEVEEEERLRKEQADARKKELAEEKKTLREEHDMTALLPPPPHVHI